jgi:hypothetical protein
MPSHGVDIIDGIPVYLKGSNMFAFRPEQSTSQPDLKLGTYDAATKKATWLFTAASTGDTWLSSFRETLAPRSRKV